MKKFCIIVGILLLSLLFAGSAQGFTQKEVVSIYEAAHEELGNKYGSLRHDVNTSLHDEFRWKWDVHYINVLQTGYSVVLMKCQEHSSKGYSYEAYYFVDYDTDGKLEYAYRKYVIVDRENLVVAINPPPELHEAIKKWKFDISPEKGQAMYEAELQLWKERLNVKRND